MKILLREFYDFIKDVLASISNGFINLASSIVTH